MLALKYAELSNRSNINMSKITPKTKSLKAGHQLRGRAVFPSLLKSFECYVVWNGWACFSWLCGGLFFLELASEHNGSSLPFCFLEVDVSLAIL